MVKVFNVNGRFLFQQTTGVQRFATELCRHLAEIPHSEVRVYVPHIDFDDPFDGKVTYIFPRFRIRNSFVFEQFILPFLCGETLFSFGGSGPFGKRRQVVVLHDAGVWDTPSSYSRAFVLKHRVFQWFYRNIGCQIATVSEFSRARLKLNLRVRNDICVLTNGWEHCRAYVPNFNRTLKGSLAANFIIIATKAKHKGLEDFFTAIVNDRRLDHVGFHFIGGSERSFQHVDVLDRENIFCYDYVSEADLFNLIAKSDGLISPSTYEGFGIPPLEAIYFGKSVILNDIPVYREIYSEAASFFELERPDTLFAAIISPMAEGYVSGRDKILSQHSWRVAADKLGAIEF
jgi:glycosyltransferase involved in cell wall biosynthesis